MKDQYNPHNGGAVMQSLFDETASAYKPSPDVVEHDFMQLSDEMNRATKQIPSQKHGR